MKFLLTHKKKLLLFLKSLITAVLIIYIYQTINKHQNILSTLNNTDIKWLSFAILLVIPNLLLQGIKWHILVKNIAPDITAWASFSSVLGGMTLGLITPGRLGELGKGLFLDHIEKWQITGLALVERIISMFAIMFCGIISLIYILVFHYEADLLFYLPLCIMLFLMLLLIFFLLFNPLIIKLWYYKLKRINRLSNILNNFSMAFKQVKAKSLLVVFIYSVIFQFLVALQFYLFVKSYDQNLQFFDGIISSFSSILTKAMLPISIGDIGVREYAADYFFSMFLNNRAAIFSGSISLFFVNVFFPAILGLFMLPKLNFQKDINTHKQKDF
jgi:uncharacterized protein (TIRG00374 family)